MIRATDGLLYDEETGKVIYEGPSGEHYEILPSTFEELMAIRLEYLDYED